MKVDTLAVTPHGVVLTRAKVTVGVIITRHMDGQLHILLGRRRLKEGETEFLLPSTEFPHQEISLLSTGASLIKESFGNEIVVADMRLLCIVNIVTKWQDHSVNIGLIAPWKKGESAFNIEFVGGLADWHPIAQFTGMQVPQPLKSYLEALCTGRQLFNAVE